jgi:hypothetical protein
MHGKGNAVLALKHHAMETHGGGWGTAPEIAKPQD